MIERNVRDVLNLYNPANSLDKAWTIPAPWYFDARDRSTGTRKCFRRELASRRPPRSGAAARPIFHHRCKRRTSCSWFAATTANSAPFTMSAVTMPPPSNPQSAGCAKQFRCPYHGWTYGNDGALKGMVEFEGVCNFDRKDNGLVPVRVDTLGKFRFRESQTATPLPSRDFLGKVPSLVAPLALATKNCTISTVGSTP